MMKKLLQSRFMYDYGSLFILLLLCVVYSVGTIDDQHPVSPSAGRKVAQEICELASMDQPQVLIVLGDSTEAAAFGEAVAAELRERGATILETVVGEPSDAREALEQIGAAGERLDAVATYHQVAQWGSLSESSLKSLSAEYSSLAGVRVYQPRSYRWPNFLTRANIFNVVKQNAPVAIIAIGMTLVIITAGIDLSVGSLVGLSGVFSAIAIQGIAGGADASAIGIGMACMFAIGICTLWGAFNGVMVTQFQIPAFVVTLAGMRIARGISFQAAVSYSESVSTTGAAGTPEAVPIEASSYAWLGQQETIGVPNPILLMILLYVIAHFVMARTAFGRYVYAVGGNQEAARLSGVPVFWVLIIVYAICGMTAGLAGVVDSSTFMGGRPKAGLEYELSVIAAVVVGGTSLAGGEGRILGTLIGAMIIAVIQNGLNMLEIESYVQMIVFGLLILVAVLLDKFKKWIWQRSLHAKAAA